MSTEQVKTFIKKMKSDDVFSGKVLAIEGVKERMEYIVNAGFDCTEEDFKHLHIITTQTKDDQQYRRVCQSCIIGYS